MNGLNPRRGVFLPHCTEISTVFSGRATTATALDPKSIDYIEVDGNYVTLRVGRMEYLSRDTIKRLSVLLAEFGFIRIERSLLMNAAAVSYAEVASHGTFALTLTSGVCLHSSAAYRDAILRP